MRPRIDCDYCKGCNICVTICPVNVYEEGKNTSARGYVVPQIAHPEKCVDRDRAIGEQKCEICIYACPDQAIEWEDE